MARDSHEVQDVMDRANHRCLLALGFGAWALSQGCLLSPQPDPPGADIVASATDGPGSVVVVGADGTVPPGSQVRVDSDADDASAEAGAGGTGAFVAVLPARPGDVLRVTYLEWSDGRWIESAPREIVVDRYDPSPEPAAADDRNISPWAPGEYDAGAGFDSTMYVDPPVAGLARVWCGAGCLQPGVRVIVANQDNAQVVEGAFTSGPFELRIRASSGDELLVFTVRTENESQTSRVVRLIVPAP